MLADDESKLIFFFKKINLIDWKCIYSNALKW